MLELKKFFTGKKVFLTGHTGFKGAWLALMLKELGATVCGYSLEPKNMRGNLYLSAHLQKHMQSHMGDICHLKNLSRAMHDFNPEIVLHLAAQAIVLASYEDPVHTFLSNAQGTVHVLECVRTLPSCKAVICITTDKCYENKEWHWAYRESDALGGKDPYSASKAMAELAIDSYRNSFLQEKGIGCASARAGNVIGGGDYTAFRILPDIAAALAKNEKIILRNPLSVRPWQHVLDALYGYLTLAKKAYIEPEIYSKAYNFAPFKDIAHYTVQAITEIYLQSIGAPLDMYTLQEKSEHKPENTLLQLDPSLAHKELQWTAHLSVPEAINLTAQWFNTVQKDATKAFAITCTQIQNYLRQID